MSTEIVDRLRARDDALSAEAAAIIEHLQALVTMLETEVAMMQGTIRTAAREADDTFRVTELPPNTPR